MKLSVEARLSDPGIDRLICWSQTGFWQRYFQQRVVLTLFRSNLVRGIQRQQSRRAYSLGRHGETRRPSRSSDQFSIYCRWAMSEDASAMADFLHLVAGCRTRDYAPGEVVMEQDSATGPLLVLIEGEVEILRDDIRVAKTAQAGAVFGEMSVLLGCAHTATVRAVRPSRLALIENPRQFLASSADASLHVAGLLAKRLDALNKYLVDVKRQYEGHDHLGMVDEVLETLMHRQPRLPAR